MMNKNLTTISVLLIVVGLLVYKFMLSPVIVEGVVNYKAVVGVKNNVSYTILLNRPIDNGSWILVKDKNYKTFFPKDEHNAFISKFIEDKIRNDYSDVKYVVSVRLNSKDPVKGTEKEETLAYFVNRDDFNRMRIWDKVKFEVSKLERHTIKRVIQIEANTQKLVEISREHPTVKKYLDMHPNATYDIWRVYLTSDGLVYQVDEHWKVKDSESVGGVGGKPVDGKNHYCWVVHWHDPTPELGVDHIVDVYIDIDNYGIVFIQEAV